MSAARHQRVADNFAAVAGAVTDWDAPTPVADWYAVDVVDHLTTWVDGFLSAGGIDLREYGSSSSAASDQIAGDQIAGDQTASEPAASDPMMRWREHSAAVQALLASPAAEEEFVHPRAGSGPLGVTLDRIYTTDVLMHTWDLARSAGVDHGLDEAECEAILGGMRGIEELLRNSGQYGPAVPVADSASAADRLMAFTGRDPLWQAG